MTRAARNVLATAAAVSALLAAAPARADHGCDDGPRRAHAYARPAPPYAPPAPVYAPAPPAALRVVVVPPWRPARWHGGWRAHELRSEYRALELAREQFYATWDGRPWTRARFEAWYSSRRAELDARW